MTPTLTLHEGGSTTTFEPTCTAVDEAVAALDALAEALPPADVVREPVVKLAALLRLRAVRLPGVA